MAKDNRPQSEGQQSASQQSAQEKVKTLSKTTNLLMKTFGNPRKN